MIPSERHFVFRCLLFCIILCTAGYARADKGDLDDSKEIDLRDALLALQVATGTNSQNVKADADVNGDNCIGIPEGVFALQVTVGLRKEPVELKLRRLLDTSFANADGTGAVLLVWSPDVQWMGATGKSNISEQRNMLPADMLRIASMTKTFTAATVLKLADDKVISLNAYLNEYLDQATVGKITNGADITVQHLLSMTSGIYDYSNDDAYDAAIENKPSREKWTFEEILSYVQNKEAAFDPGTGWEYSNTNYILLEMIVEKTTGMTLAQNIRGKLLEPLGMTNTFMELREEREGGFGGLIVRGYGEGDTAAEDITETNDGLGMGDGGLISDAAGLAKFLTGLLKDKTILSHNSLSLMTGFGNYADLDELPPDEKKDAKDYGLGLSRTTASDYGEAWGHEGKTCGFLGDMQYVKDKDTVVVLLTNYEDNPNYPEDIINNVLDTLFKG